MSNFEKGENKLSQQGVVPTAEREAALESQRAELDAIAKQAVRALEVAGGDHKLAIEEAEALNDAKLVEKLKVMQNVALAAE